MSAHRRLFAGIALAAGARRACTSVAEALRGRGFAAVYEDAAKLHLTLAFLGNMPESRCDEMARRLRMAAAGVAPFGIVLDRLGAFPHERKPRVVYVGARDQGAAFRGLARAVRAAYAAGGFVFHDDPVAHVTIARVKAPAQVLPMVEVSPIPIAAGEIHLFESRYDKAANTSRYETLTCAALGDRRAPGTSEV